ncbi:MAG TPA: VOC family protein [Candidatus Angelobacter sp.]|nr:VOC family protein [Candidatus Angelobacter sp.]
MPPEISRRSFLAFAAATLVSRPTLAAGDKISAVPADLDHILLGISNVDHGISWLEERSGVRAMFGGVHPGRGTLNALLSLGPRRYLEVIAPDPQQSSVSNEMVDLLRKIQEPRLIGWAAHTNDLGGVMQKAAAAGIAIENPRDGSRTRPDGKTLHWKSFSLKEDYAGVLPFFIEWSAGSVHPSQDAPAGCTLQNFFVESPAVKEVRSIAAKLGLNLEAKPGKKPFLGARIAGRKGAFELG